MNNPTLDQWKRGLAIAEQIAVLEKELAAILHGQSIAASPAAKAAPVTGKRKKGKMSAAGRARIVAAQKARWAKIKAGKKVPAGSKVSAKAQAPKAPEKKKKKRTMSPEVKAKLAAAMKARWAAAKAGKGPAPTAKKK
jgi:hypothetical protein